MIMDCGCAEWGPYRRGCPKASHASLAEYHTDPDRIRMSIDSLAMSFLTLALNAENPAAHDAWQLAIQAAEHAARVSATGFRIQEETKEVEE